MACYGMFNVVMGTFSSATLFVGNPQDFPLAILGVAIPTKETDTLKCDGKHPKNRLPYHAIPRNSVKLGDNQ